MLDKKKYPLKFHLVSGLGSGIILSLAVIITYALWIQGMKNHIYMGNYTTSIFFTEGLISANGAAPFALFSVNCFACRKLIQKWRKFIKKLLS